MELNLTHERTKLKTPLGIKIFFEIDFVNLIDKLKCMLYSFIFLSNIALLQYIIALKNNNIGTLYEIYTIPNRENIRIKIVKLLYTYMIFVIY